MPAKKSRKQRNSAMPRGVLLIGGAMVSAVLVACGTFYLNTLTVRSIEVTGSAHASASLVRELSGAAVGDTLYRLDPAMIESRVLGHPWIEQAEVTRWPTGSLSIDILERTPVVLAVSALGRPTHYLDPTGVRLPIDTVSQYDVPLLRGRSNVERDTATIELLGVLASLKPSVDGLLSDLIVKADGEIEAVTVPVNDDRCVSVRLGRGDYARKLRTLRAFWTQAVAGFPNKRIEWIDLRFRGQVVTKEETVIS